MKITKHKNKKTIGILAVVAAVILLGVGTVSAYYAGIIPGTDRYDDDSKNIDGVNYDKSSDEQLDAGEDIKKDFVEDKYGDGEGGDKSPIVLTITNHAADEALSVYQFRTFIQTTSAEGSCQLTMTAEGKPVISKKLGVQRMGSYAVCAGYFDVPLADLEGAMWTASITYDGPTEKGVSDSVEVSR